MLVPVLMFSTGFMITARIPPDSTVEIPMIGPTWDSATNEVIIARQGPDINFDYDINFYISVALDGIEVIRGKPVLGVLDKLLGEVESILLSIEAEAKRLGLFR